MNDKEYLLQYYNEIKEKNSIIEDIINMIDDINKRKILKRKGFYKLRIELVR